MFNVEENSVEYHEAVTELNDCEVLVFHQKEASASYVLMR